jgi:hypothetical protein
MGVITWRVLQLDRQRSEARVAALSAAADDTGGEGPVASRATPDAAEPALSAPSLFAVPRSSGAGRWLSVSAVAAVACVAAAVGSTAFRSHATVGEASGAKPAVVVPLELLDLGHSTQGGHVAIRGRVRNPSDAAPMAELEAVVSLYDRAGEFLGTARAAVSGSTLEPGRSAEFRVPVADGLAVSRYRLTFEVRSTPLPHIDRREPVGPASASGSGVARNARAANADAAGR